MELFIEILSLILKILTGYAALMGIFCLFPRKRYPLSPCATKFAVLVPARNEERVIIRLIESLKNQRYPEEMYDIFVIPNNCTDDTEEKALHAGVKILRCMGPTSTKGEVLHQILAQIMGQYDAYCVFDADNVVDPEFLARMNDAVAAGAQVAKSRQCALNPYDTWVSGSYDLYFQGINLLHSRARMHFPLSAKLVGTGFMVTDRLLQRMNGWNTHTMTEDIEFAAQCAMLGQKVYYVPDALTYDEEPVSFCVSMRQRRRWSAGVQSVANHYSGKLLYVRPSWLCWDLASHINMIYVQLLALIPLLYGLLSLSMKQAAENLGLSLAGFILGGIAMGLFLSLTARRSLRRQWKAILLYPVFLASWYPLHIWALFSKPKTWKPIEHGTAKAICMHLEREKH